MTEKKIQPEPEIMFDDQISMDELERQETFEEVNVTKATNVVQSNFLIENKPKMKADELKMFSTLVATINKDDQDLKNIKLKVTDIIDLWEIPQKNAYRKVKAALAGLLDKKFALERYRPDGTRYVEMATYISKFAYGEGDGYATVVIDPMFKPFLIDLKERYTLFGLDEVLGLETSQAIRTYELLRQYEVLGQRSFTVADYKKKLGIEDKYKGSNANLKKNVLEKVVKEISERTQIMTRYDLTGRGEKAVITFIIYKKEGSNLDLKKDKKNFGKQEKDIVMQLLKDETDMDTVFPDDKILEAIEIATEGVRNKSEILTRFNVIKDALVALEDRQAGDDVKYPWAYFKKILESKVKDIAYK